MNKATNGLPALQPPVDELEFRYLEFSERPLSDACWSVQTGPDGKVYIASCIEHTGGQSATVVRYDRGEDKLEYLFEVDEVTGDLRDSGRATQCKIHYSFVPDRKRNLLYAATHLSGAPKGMTHYDPWHSWMDPKLAFQGAYLILYDTEKDQVRDKTLMIPREGCRCLALNEERGLLYAITYPRDHFVVFDLEKRSLQDYGRIGSVNTQCIFTDRRGRAHWTDDRGQFLRFDPDEGRIRELPHHFPHAPYQSNWHGVLYDACPDANHESIFCVPWKTHPHLARFWPEEGKDGVLDDLGPITQERDEHQLMSVNIDHVGGLFTGVDGALYYTRSQWEPLPDRCLHGKNEGILTRYDPEAGRTKDLLSLHSSNGSHHYVSRAAMDEQGNVIMGKILTSPAGVYRLPPFTGTPTRLEQCLRLWG